MPDAIFGSQDRFWSITTPNDLVWETCLGVPSLDIKGPRSSTWIFLKYARVVTELR